MAEDDKIQRQMEFIVTNQAQFTSDVQELKGLHKQAETRITKLDDVCLRLGNALVNLAETTSEAHKEFDARMVALAASQEHTDQKLNALIDIVTQERNGKAGRG